MGWELKLIGMGFLSGGWKVKISLQRWLHDSVNVQKKLDSILSMGELYLKLLKHTTHTQNAYTYTHSQRNLKILLRDVSSAI